MRIDRRFIVVMTISLVWAFLVAAFFYRMVGGSGARAESGKPMVVASRPLPLGATVDRDSVKIRNVPPVMFPSGAYSRVEEVLERPVISPIQPDEPIVDARLAAKGSGLGLAPLIPAGMRAISVRVNDVVGVAGFILPGMRVDVLVTGRPPNQANTLTRTVLQNVGVLSAGQTIQTDGKSPAITTPVVTLVVTPQEAETLTLANNEGHIQLVLRNSTDRLTAETRGRELHDLYGRITADPQRETAPRDEPPVRRRPAPPAGVAVTQPPPVIIPLPEPAQMVITKGATKTVFVFSKDGAIAKESK